MAIIDEITCPLPAPAASQVILAHGGGGRLMHRLIEHLILPAVGNPILAALHDGAVVEVGGTRLAFTTDSYVVRPLKFPGGDIARLAVNGTVNDLAMCGARPLVLSAGLILEEGLGMDLLGELMQSLGRAAAEAGVVIVTGDTKVVDRGKGDGIFINTAGIGIVEASDPIGPSSVRPGDVVLLSGDIGRHGIAIMASREGLAFETAVESDCAPLTGPVLHLLQEGVRVHCLRDLTRGGLGAALVEIARGAGQRIEIDEAAIPVRPEVQAACELLGLDPLYVANEGRFIAFVEPQDADRALGLLRTHAVSADAVVLGRVVTGVPEVVATGVLGTTRVIDLPSGEQLPRIC
ncbi:MAG: hydrogenase expression/formation protein HypE [Armatimonadota bacterium]|nr:hydrogenase expression/formation protein HypE [Armatimonadota bacterium]MDR7450563.1 hydrogenase expression/formation protein HypE [Armatimonadota bacterium]MDR7466304.1 hydrogenase expression/formation protein HypE [Armatimonadota bacterium]MDR7493025.1 hydrogenase expression/formation protein HypE [Armatimonadota bacterium]MDR7498218.1 hydrogenase expression/formation protein HypE [Armatimonadota bacterium]